MRAANAERRCVEVGECRPQHRSHKNTRDWCKGRVGMAHEFAWRLDSDYLRWPRRPGRCERLVLVCVECGKRAPWSWRTSRYRCYECWTIARGFFVTHGQNCSQRDYRFRPSGYGWLFPATGGVPQ